MADRTVRVRVVADTAGFAAGMRAAGSEATALGAAATRAGRGTRALATEAAGARGGLTALGSGARGGAAAAREAEAAAVAAGRGIRTIGTEASAAAPAFGRIGAAARTGMGSVRSGTESALSSVKHLGTLLAGGAILYGLHDIVHAGNEYNDAMNKFLEVTRASGGQMAAAGREAQALGADMKLPSANAAEAADAMVELAKAGLSAQDAIKATRGTIQLSAAARTDVSTAARIEGDIMDQFALKSSDAAKVADTLANTANSASGELMDIYYAMKYVGPIAHTVGVSLQDTATAVGLLGKSGIIGETAGTALRSALVNMSKPTDQMKEGLKTLGIQAYDVNGKFKGLQYIITQLGAAQEHLTTQQFTSAAAMAFGKPALAAMVALAHQGGPAFEQFGQQVGRVGGAAALAAAESKGLGGAMRGLGKQVSSAFLQVYLGIAPGLEKITRAMTGSVSAAIPYIKSGIRIAGDLWDIYGPTVEHKLEAAKSGISKAAESMVTPLKTAVTNLAVATVPLAVTSVQSLGQVASNAQAALGPLVSGMHDLFGSVASGSGALGVLSGRLQVGVGWLGQMSAVLRPIGELVGGIAHAFAGLPGPIQLSVLSMLALRPFRPQIQGLQQTVTGFGRSAVSAFRGIGAAMQTQEALASHYGIQLTRTGAAFAAIEARVPVVRAMGESFRNASGGVSGFTAAIGVGARAGLSGAMRGLYGFLGGPWGVAISGVMIGLDMLAKKQQQAAAAAAAHQQRVSNLAASLQQAGGAIDGNVRATVVQTLADAKALDGKTALLDVMGKAHVSALQLTNAYMGQSGGVEALRQKLLDAAKAMMVWHGATSTDPDVVKAQADQIRAYQKAADELGHYSGELPDAIARSKDLAAAVKGDSSAALDATNPTGRLQAAIKTLGDSTADADTKARALHQALNLLSGGELDVEAAVAIMNQNMLDLNATWKDGIDKTKGYKDQLLQVDGSLNTTSENGQTLWNKMQALNEGTAGAAQATYDLARANGTAVVPALQQAEAHMQKSWEAAVTTAQKFGISKEAAMQLAAQMGFIPSSLAITMSTPGLTDTQKQLLYVQGLAGHMPKDSTIRVSALTAEAVKDITSVGFKVKTLPGGRQMEITAPTGKAAAALNALIAMKLPPKALDVNVATGPAKAAIDTIKNYLGMLKSRHVTVYVDQVGHANISGGPGHSFASANGNLFRAYASGGVEQHVAQIAPGGAMRLWAEPETGGEAYIPLAGSKRGRSMAILAEVAKQFGYRLEKFASGGLLALASGGQLGPGFSYAPTDPLSTFGADSGMTRYNNTIQALKDAWDKLTSAMKTAADKTKAVKDAEAKLGQTRKDENRKVSAAEDNLSRVRHGKHTHAQLIAAEKRLSDARYAAAKADAAAEKRVKDAKAAEKKANADVSSARKSVNAADAALGLKNGAKAPSGFNLAGYQKQLAAAAKANAAWENNLSNIGKRAGADVAETLRGMGEDGQALVAALAKASGKQFADIVANLKKLAPTAKATLADYTNQLKSTTGQSQAFQANLLKLASMGYGDLATQLAAQGDDTAASIAAAAVASPSSAAAANTAAKSNAGLLSSEDVTNAVKVIGALKARSGEDFARLVTDTGLDVSTLLTLLPKIRGQIDGLPAGNKQALLAQWSQLGLPTPRTAVQAGTGSTGSRSTVKAMAVGGILPAGSSVVLAGERGAEAYIPLDGSARSRALLALTASRLGYQLRPAGHFASSASAPRATPAHVDNSRTVVLNGAKQSSAEQVADVLRHMTVLG